MSNIFKIFLSSVLFLLLGNNLALSQNLISFNFVDSGVTEGKTIRLEAFEYRPVNWNGKVILMSHGSTGGKAEVVKNTIKFLNISKEANAREPLQNPDNDIGLKDVERR